MKCGTALPRAGRGSKAPLRGFVVPGRVVSMGLMTSVDVWTVRELRRRWKPAKERLQALRADHPTVIRVHRCCSWMQRIEQENLQATDDAALIFRWIAMNSLYGRWNEQRREPAGDRHTLGKFVSQVLELDASEHVVTNLMQHKQLVMKIMDDEYLAARYWEEPTDETARRTKKTVFDVRQYYLDGRFYRVFLRLLERIYLMRCQLVHGAATAGGKLNRTSLRRCNIMLGHLLPAVLLVIIDHGEDADWGALCYPPMENGAG